LIQVVQFFRYTWGGGDDLPLPQHP